MAKDKKIPIAFDTDFNISIEQLKAKIEELKFILSKIDLVKPKTEKDKKRRAEMVIKGYERKALLEGLLLRKQMKEEKENGNL